MNILYITRKYPPSIGGMQTQSYEFHNALKGREKVFSITWGRSQKLLSLFLISIFFKGIFFLAAKKIDFIQVGDLALSPVGLFFKILSGKRVFAMAHGKDTAFDNAIYRFFVIGPAKKLDGVICVSRFLRERLIKRGLCGEKLFVNPNGINIDEYTKTSDKQGSRSCLEEEFGLDLKNKNIILSVSRMVRKKGMALFVKNIFPRIVQRFPGTCLLLVGEAKGPESRAEKSEITAYAEKAGLNGKVHFLGDIEYGDIMLRNIYSAADIFVMPNRHYENDYEGFGIVALEASLNKVPVVAFSVDGIPDAVSDGNNGFLVPEDDDEAFAGTVNSLLKDNSEAERLGEKAGKFVRENYNWDVIVDNYLRIIKAPGL